MIVGFFVPTKRSIRTANGIYSNTDTYARSIFRGAKPHTVVIIILNGGDNDSFRW